MFTKNNEEMGYCNGSTGIITGTYEHDEYGLVPVVKLSTGGQIIVEPESWAILNDAGEEIASVVQIPLRLAWSITVHKSQGMSLDAAEIDLSRSFTPGHCEGCSRLSRACMYPAPVHCLQSDLGPPVHANLLTALLLPCLPPCSWDLRRLPPEPPPLPRRRRTSTPGEPRRSSGSP